MTLDGSTGALVNVTPGAKPQDAYKAVLNETLRLLREPTPELLNWAAERNSARLREWERDRVKGKDVSKNPPQKLVLPNDELAQWGEEVGRKLAKRVVMTVPYAATPHSNRGYIKDAIEEYQEAIEKELKARIGRYLTKEEKRRPSGAELSIYTHVMLYAMERVVPGPIAVMNWIKQNVKSYFGPNPDGVVQYTTPSGFPVVQDKRHVEVSRVKTQLLGEVIQNRIATGTKGVNIDKHQNCSAPNFIHSMDASLLHLSFAGFEHPFTLIHDSILTTATDMGYMAGVIREQFVELYKDMPLLQYANTIQAEAPAHLIKGTMDVESVTKSDYFFC